MDTNFSPSSCKEQIRDFAISCGFDACGFAEAAPVDENQIAAYRKWLDSGKNGTMDYMCRHLPLRDNPSELLPGAKTIISLAANYYPQSFQPENAPQFAYYAYGKDYHDAVKCRLSKIAEFMKANWDCECRCCVDTAPLRERCARRILL